MFVTLLLVCTIWFWQSFILVKSSLLILLSVHDRIYINYIQESDLFKLENSLKSKKSRQFPYFGRFLTDFKIITFRSKRLHCQIYVFVKITKMISKNTTFRLHVKEVTVWHVLFSTTWSKFWLSQMYLLVSAWSCIISISICFGA